MQRHTCRLFLNLHYGLWSIVFPVTRGVSVKTSSPWARDCVLTMCRPTSGVSAILHIGLKRKSRKSRDRREASHKFRSVPMRSPPYCTLRGRRAPIGYSVARGKLIRVLKTWSWKSFVRLPLKKKSGQCNRFNSVIEHIQVLTYEKLFYFRQS